MVLYAALTILALWFNRADTKMLLLTSVVAGSFFVEPPTDTPLQFYVTWITVDLAVGLFAFYLRAAASEWIFEIALVMVAAHVMGWHLEGYRPLSPYKAIMHICEFTQILVCLVASRQAAAYLKKEI